ncbi:GNAT family N-acetyltransferase [Shouchella lonarensis]|uniref:Acetyltransferase (GNAT) family protein n=1 Tax=Shouchella lonarensis TaxID=1464122 RepID=A0A1G6GL47_9BACI|nr:GNAT family N-acetyltransferase [Shouchella lonarensis]SDB82465.1 Acetyltransferase (GNAT) family protein [Shouchella lonarensis]
MTATDMIEVIELTSTSPLQTRQQLIALFQKQLHEITTPQALAQVEEMLESVLVPQSQAHLFVAQLGGETIAFAFFNVLVSFQKGGSYIWLNELYVEDAYRNRGIARKLLLKIVYWAEHRKMKGIELETGLNNEATKALYNSLGFYEVVSKRYSFRF